MPSLTSHLLHQDTSLLQKATQHPFLSAAAHASLSPAHLKHWLAQDRLYALSYINFVGSLLARIPIASSADRESTLEWRITDALIDCLTNIRRELKLFEETASAEGWLDDICDDVRPSNATRAYQDLFAGAASPSRPLAVGLVVLWATEECYLRSWRYAWTQMDQSLKAKEKDVMQRVFIPNWSSPEFEAMVRRLGALVNKFGNTMEEGEWEWKECEEAFGQVVWAEKNFWPEV